jgi:hypothetical protein
MKFPRTVKFIIVLFIEAVMLIILLLPVPLEPKMLALIIFLVVVAVTVSKEQYLKPIVAFIAALGGWDD